MLCKYPVQIKNTQALRKCGYCTHCRVNHARVLTNRIVCERVDHDDAAFVTLTYDDDHLPKEYFDDRTGEVFVEHSLVKRDYQLFLKSIRERADRLMHGRKLRFYCVGEYGEKTQRPHYHLALFGFPSCPVRGACVVGGRFRPCTCEVCRFVQSCWDNGHIFVGDVEADSARYMADYVTKKWTSNKCRCRGGGHHEKCPQVALAGRLPEFAKWSQGLGSGVLDNLVSALTTYGFESENLPRVVMHGSKALPLGRYLSDKLYDRLGVTFEPGERLKKFETQVRDLLLSSENLPSYFTSALQAPFAHTTALAMEFLNSQKSINLEKRIQLFNKEKVHV